MFPDITETLKIKKIRLVMALRQQGITDTAVLSAIERVPREQFVPQAFADQAYEDIALPIGRGQTISQPFIVAYMTQALQLNDRQKVLEVGTGSGYQTAILSQLARRVYTIERHKPLFQEAQRQFDDLSLRNITAIVGDGMQGWPLQAPFDRIIVTAGAFDEPPRDLLDQLAIQGRMIIPVGHPATGQFLCLFRRESNEVISMQRLVETRFVPLLPNIAKDEEGRYENAVAS